MSAARWIAMLACALAPATRAAAQVGFSVRVNADSDGVALRYARDSVWFALSTPSGVFAVAADSFAIAAWADSAATRRPSCRSSTRRSASCATSLLSG
jgi:hypothetical protein